MWKGIVEMYNDPDMLYIEGSLHNNTDSDLPSKYNIFLNALLFSFYEYKNTYLKNVDVSK